MVAGEGMSDGDCLVSGTHISCSLEVSAGVCMHTHKYELMVYVLCVVWCVCMNVNPTN